MRFAILLTLLALSGCSLFSPTYDRCDKTPAYAGAGELPPLQVPPGVAAPDTRNALDIPQVTAPAPVLKGTCIDAPPRYKVDQKEPAKG